MDLGKYLNGFLIFGLFVIALISFGVNMGTDNSANIIITDNNSAISSIYSGVNDTIYNYKDDANDSFTSFNVDGDKTGLSSSIGDFFIKGILNVGKSIMGVGNAMFNATFGTILKAIGLPEEVVTIVGIVISMILLFSIILMAWKLYRTGI